MTRFILKTWVGMSVFVSLMVGGVCFIFLYPIDHLEAQTRLQAKGFVYEKPSAANTDEASGAHKPLQGVESMILFRDSKKLKKSELDEMFLKLHAEYASIPEIETAFSRLDGSYSVIGIKRHSIDITFWKKISDGAKAEIRVEKIWVIYRKAGYKDLIIELDVKNWPNTVSSKSTFQHIKDVFLVPLH